MANPKRLPGDESDRPRLKGDWRGRYVLSRRPLETRGGAIFPAGTVFLVERNHGGLNLEKVTPCQECQSMHRVRITKIPERDVRLLREDFDPREEGLLVDPTLDEEDGPCSHGWHDVPVLLREDPSGRCPACSEGPSADADGTLSEDFLDA